MADVRTIPLHAIEGFLIGHATDAEAGTGTTVIVAPKGAVGGVDVRGGAPASRETDLLKPENTVQEAHAVCLSGGSAYGLAAASGVATALEKRGIGLDVGVGIVPIVCGSCVFDLACGDPAVRPGASFGERAVEDAFARAGQPVEEGNVGAGAGATVGKLHGPECAMKGGMGASALAVGSLQVGAVAVVNACGNVYDPKTLSPVAGMRAAADSNVIVSMEDALLEEGEQAVMPLDRTNTTISCVVTNARLTQAEATKVAQMAADAYAHVIRPTHTSNDGDTVYVLSSGAVEAPIDVVGTAAVRALEQALVRGCTEAAGAYGYPAARDLHPDGK